MDIFAANLRARAELLGMSNAEVAERAGLDARRYGHYVTGRNEPDLATLMRISQVLKTTPNQLLGIDDPRFSSKLNQLIIACQHLEESQLDMLLNFAEASLRKK